jgi:NAD(P)H-hydrate epimerase
VRRVLLAEEARALEREAEARGISVETLMERAGYAVARAAAELAHGVYGRRAVVVCGKGNNGGDGFVAARYLDAWGMRVSALLVAGEDPREPAATNLRRLGGTDVRVRPFSRTELERADVVIDAILGIGLRGAPGPPYSGAIEALGGVDVPVLAVDLPSGVDSDTGATPGASVHPDLTVTFGAPKVGTVLGPAGGEVRVVDIGFPETTGDGPRISLVEEGDALLPPARPRDATKRDAVVLVIAGSRDMTGAPTLVASGAYRAGAGHVTLAVPGSILPVVQGAHREAVFLPLPEGPSGSIAEAAWEVLAERCSGSAAVAVGPGLSTDDATQELVRRLVRECPVPLVVDADGINAFAGRVEEAADRKADLVLTPHAGELGRLLGRSSDEVIADRLGCVRDAAEAASASVLLKGAPTLVAEPGGDVRVVTTGTPALATAGTGDVLAGVIAAFVARGGTHPRMDDAATAGAYVHGLAGRLAGERLAEGTTASDVAGSLPEVLRALRGAP